MPKIKGFEVELASGETFTGFMTISGQLVPVIVRAICGPKAPSTADPDSGTDVEFLKNYPIPQFDFDGDPSVVAVLSHLKEHNLSSLAKAVLEGDLERFDDVEVKLGQNAPDIVSFQTSSNRAGEGSINIHVDKFEEQ